MSITFHAENVIVRTLEQKNVTILKGQTFTNLYTRRTLTQAYSILTEAYLQKQTYRNILTEAYYRSKLIETYLQKHTYRSILTEAY